MSLFDMANQSVDNLDFSNRTYLITGAANGIGKALSIALSKFQASVILLDKDDKGLNLVYDEISKIDNAEPVIVHQDLAQLTQDHCEVLTTQIHESFGRLNGLVHCAAETGHLAPIEHYADEDWARVIWANLHSPYMLTRKLVSLLNTNDQATVIFTLSEQARKSTAFWGAFAVAQQGLKALIETWSQETENNNTNYLILDPGKVNTDYLTQLYPGLNAENYPDPKTIAKAYLLLLSDSKNLHGKFLQIKDLQLEILD